MSPRYTRLIELSRAGSSSRIVCTALGSWLPISYAAPRQQLKQDHPERIHIAAHVQFQQIGQHLLGTHVGQGPYELSQIGLARGLRIGIGRARHPEIEDLGLAGLIHQVLPGFRSRWIMPRWWA